MLAPALNRRLSHWMSDLRGARLGAQERLAVSLAALAAARVDATGRVGDPTRFRPWRTPSRRTRRRR